MFQEYKKFWLNYANFTGRSTRTEFWLAFLVHTLIYFFLFSIVTFLPAFMVATLSNYRTIAMVFALVVALMSLLFALYFMAFVVPMAALAVRRLRDAGFHWAFIFLIFVPFGNLALLFMLCQPSVPYTEDNYQYIYQQEFYRNMQRTQQNQAYGYQETNQNQAQAQAFDQGQEPLINQKKAEKEDSNQPF